MDACRSNGSFLIFSDQLTTLTSEDTINQKKKKRGKELIQIKAVFYSVVSTYLLYIHPGGIIYVPTYTGIKGI